MIKYDRVNINGLYLIDSLGEDEIRADLSATITELRKKGIFVKDGSTFETQLFKTDGLYIEIPADFYDIRLLQVGNEMIFKDLLIKREPVPEENKAPIRAFIDERSTMIEVISPPAEVEADLVPVPEVKKEPVKPKTLWEKIKGCLPEL